MRYLIIIEGENPFLTDYFDFDNNYTFGIGMTVIDSTNMLYINDENNGLWKDIEEDHL